MDVMSLMKSNLALFHALIFGELLYTRVKRGVARATPLEVEIGARAVQHISREIGDPTRAVTDETVCAVVILGYSGRVAAPRPRPEYPRQSSLRKLQSLDVYCKMEIVMHHVQGLVQMVEVMGGVQKLKTPGMAQLLSFCGIKGACRFLQKPAFPFLAHSDSYLTDGRLSVSAQEHAWARRTLGRLGQGFGDVWGQPTGAATAELCEVLRHICDFTVVVENHTEGRWIPRTFTVIIDQRNFVQHRLMSLRTAQELGAAGLAVEEPLYECCRLAMIVYSFLVVFPLPPEAGPFEALVASLRAELSRATAVARTHPPAPSRWPLLLWIITMGAIAAIGLPERPWFAVQARTAAARMAMGDWIDMRDVLQSFLWLSSTSDPDGRDLWAEMAAGSVPSGGPDASDSMGPMFDAP